MLDKIFIWKNDYAQKVWTLSIPLITCYNYKWSVDESRFVLLSLDLLLWRIMTRKTSTIMKSWWWQEWDGMPGRILRLVKPMDSMNCYFNSHLVIRNNFVQLNFFLNFTGKRPNMLDADSLWTRKGLCRTASSVKQGPRFRGVLLRKVQYICF